jgi:hypothetical protein
MSVYAGPEITSNGLVLSLDAANPKSYSPNVFVSPTDIYGWVNTSVGSASTLSRDNLVTPVGTMPLKMAVTGNDPNTPTYNTSAWNLSRVQNGETWVVSVWAKSSINTSGQIFVFGADSTGTSYVSGNYIGLTAKTFNITTQWQRFDCNIAFSNASVAHIQTRLDGPDTGYGTDGATRPTIWWDGLQVEKGTFASTFNPLRNANSSFVIDLTNVNSANTNNVTYTSNNSFSFNGTNSSITIPFNSSSFTFNTEQTISIWLRPTDLSARRNPYAQAYGGGGTITQELDGTFTYYHGSAGVDGLPYQGSVSGFAIIANETAMITVVRNASDVRFYKNAVLGGVTTNGFSANTVTGTSSLRIGSGYVSNYQGNIFKVDVYNRALSAQEVRQNFYANRGRFGI